MTTPLLEVEGLRVDYEDVTAVDDVSFAIEAGMVYGLIGPNGAGKTSIIRVIATLLEPTYGTVRVGGLDLVADPLAVLPRIGFMPDFPPVYEDLTVREFLLLFAGAHGLPRSARGPRVEALVDQVGLTAKLDSAAGALSRGMRQRLFLAKTLLHDPDVMLLDEPASGLDPLARHELSQLIKSLGAQGKAVLVSSHILAEMADFCNSVGIMEQGRMVVSGHIEDILRQLQTTRRMTVRLLTVHDGLGEFLAGRGGLEGLALEGPVARFTMDAEAEVVAQLLADLVAAGFPVQDFHERPSDLQDIFMQVSTGAVS